MEGRTDGHSLMLSERIYVVGIRIQMEKAKGTKLDERQMETGEESGGKKGGDTIKLTKE